MYYYISTYWDSCLYSIPINPIITDYIHPTTDGELITTNFIIIPALLKFTTDYYNVQSHSSMTLYLYKQIVWP